MGCQLRGLSRRKRGSEAMLACSAPAVLAEAAEKSADGGGADFREQTLIPDGVTRMADGDLMRLDAGAANDVIREIKHRGVDLQIDLDHASIYQIPKGRPAPAVGWVRHKTVTYVPGLGIRGKVDWNEDGAALLLSKAYRYMSPAVIYHKRTGRVRRLHSVTLTNTPLTRNAPALMKAASEALFGDLNYGR